MFILIFITISNFKLIVSEFSDPAIFKRRKHETLKKKKITAISPPSQAIILLPVCPVSENKIEFLKTLTKYTIVSLS